MVYCGVKLRIIFLMQIISWNIRGLGRHVKKRFLFKLIKKRKPEIVLVQETKLGNIERVMVQRIWGNGNFEFASSNSVGGSGGLLTIWNNEFFRAQNIIVHRSFILVEGLINNDFHCCIVNIYAPNEVNSRHALWNEILIVKPNFPVPWCMGGDFNEIKAISERVGCQGVDRGMREFWDFGNDMEVVDIPMIGRKFTWTNFQDHAIHSRLDRFLVSQ